MAKIIYDTQMLDLVESLHKDHLVYVPVENDMRSFSSQFKFKPYEKGDKLTLRYPVTILPPTDLFLPAKDPLFSFLNDKISAPKDRDQVIFGLSLEDLEGIRRLYTIFKEPIEESTMTRRMEKTLLIAIDKFSAPADIPFDIYLQEIEEGVFMALAGSKRGKAILDKSHFKDHKIMPPKVLPARDRILSDPLLPIAIKKSKNHPIWEELSKICFGCGICSYVCPLCYCYETSDDLEFGEEEAGSRCRTWDSCMLKSFADTTHHNFRPELKNRIYNWYFHKFVRMPKEYGFTGCIDCNRCVIYCPSKINYRRTLQVVLDDYKKKVGK
jgi:sulfhydrogenase subunit beta (sulfur reductase)